MTQDQEVILAPLRSAVKEQVREQSQARVQVKVFVYNTRVLNRFIYI